MNQISLLTRIGASPEEVYEQIASSEGIEKWFTEAKFSTDEESGKLKLRLWGNTDFEVTESTRPVLMRWHCVSQGDPWFGTDIVFAIKPDDDKTIVVFDHLGWPEISDFYRDCAMSWAYFLESLRTLLEDGAGTPEGVAPKCEATAT